MKRTFSTVLCLIITLQLFLVTAYARPDWPSDTGIESSGGIVIDADSGAVLFGQNIHQPYYPASITKLLTALVVLEHASLDETVSFSYDAVYNVEAGSGNALSLEEGDQLSVEDCLYALLLRSSNQAANALAEHVGGSREGFVDMMNETIARLGCTESHWKNPSGLNDDEQVTTAYDMSRIARAAFANPTLLTIASTPSYTLPATINNPDGLTFTQEHKMLKEADPNYYADAIAGKTGYTSLAGQTLVTYAKREDRSLITVILKSNLTHYSDTATLLDFGFSRFQNLTIADQETAYVTGEEPLTLGNQTYQPSDLMIQTDAKVTLPNNASFSDLDKELITALPADAPETAIARIQYSYNERVVGTAYLCLKELPAAETTPETTSPETVPSTETVSDTGNESKDPADGQSTSHFSPAMITILVMAVLAVSGLGYMAYQRKKEADDRAARRARRLKRLEEDGITEEEFANLLNMRNSGKQKSDENKEA
ncbi:MAG: D-alanyl-D-alanine carboxypeptidase family protein [Lachnospiraceae bacterium]